MKNAETDPVALHFQSCLAVRQRPDGNAVPAIAKGDCTIMLQLIRMKLDDFDTPIDPANPGRFRGTTVLQSDMEAVLGAVPKLHYTKWGASHVRGALRDDAKRGNKRHLIRMIELLNAYESTPDVLRKVYQSCIRLHHQYWESFSLKVTVQEIDPFQKRLFSLLSLPSLGRVQQGLVYSALRRRYGAQRRIATKKTFAADEQSSVSGDPQRGDVQVWSDADELAIALEVKDAVIDSVVWQRVEATHGRHDYALFVLGTSFRPKQLQQEISSLEATYALHLADFLMTLVFTISADEGVPPEQVLTDILDLYNREFCEQIEKDASIKITLEET